MLYIYIITTLVLIAIGYFVIKKLFNPITIFNLIWLVIVVLYQLQLSNLQVSLSKETYYVFLINNLVFSISFLIAHIVRLKRNTLKIDNNVVINYSVVKKMFYIWCFFELIEVIVSGGIPILWILSHASKTYAHFGIPSLHGCMNSLGLIIILLAWYLFLFDEDKTKKKRLIEIIAFILFYYLCLITRQVIISAVIEMFSMYVFYKKKIPWKKLIKLGFVGVILFGIVGNIRTGYDNFLNVSVLKTNAFNSLFVGVYWVYMYLTMTVANINYSVIHGISGYGLYPIAKSFIPTAISNIIFKEQLIKIPSSIVTPAFNVSGYFKEFYIGFGTLGVFIISAIYGILGAIIFKKYLANKSEKNILYYSIYLQIILLSFFANHLLYLPSGFQLVIVYLLFRKKCKND